MARSKGSNWWKVLIALVMIACIAVDAWYLYIHFFGPEKIISNTYEIDGVTLTDGTKKNFIEVRYHANSDGTGFEMLDIKFNYLLDETKTKIVSQGLQFVSNSKADKIKFDYVQDVDNYANVQGGNFINKLVHGDWYYCGAYQANEDSTTRYNYVSTDNFVTTGISTNPITNDSMFKITLGEENDIYGIKFTGKYDATDFENCTEANLHATHQKQEWIATKTTNYFAYEDSNMLAMRLYEYVKTLSAGTAHQVIIPFGDMFEYYSYNGSQYSNDRLTATDLVNLDINSYIVINFETFSTGAKKASDSLFNALHGSQSYNLTGDWSSEDYFTGKTVINVDVYDFDLVEVFENCYCLKLEEDFVNYYTSYSKQIMLKIEIDLDVLSQKGFSFAGFTNDSQLGLFTVSECYTLETVDGIVVKTEVAV